jgi:hypothetical protein
MDSRSNGLGRWLACGAIIGVLVCYFRGEFGPWVGAGVGYNVGGILGGAVGGAFLAALVWALRRWAGRKPAAKY